MDPGEKVSVHLGALSPVTSAPYAWSTVSPKPIGGLVVDLDEGPLESAQSSGGSAGRLAGTIAGAVVAAAALALGVGARYVRRRRRHQQ